MTRSSTALLTWMAVFACTGTAFAQSPAVRRRTLVDQALAARARGDHAGAVDLFLQAGEIQMRPGLRLSLAQEYQALGDLRSACQQATACVAELQSEGDRTESGVVTQDCPTLVRSTCSVVDRSTVAPVVSAPVVTPAVVRTPHPRTVESDGPSRVGPVLMFVTSGVSLAAAGVLWILAQNAAGQCVALNGTGYCANAATVQSAQNAPGEALAGNVLVGVSAAALVTGVIWWIASGSGGSGHVTANVSPEGGAIVGRF